MSDGSEEESPATPGTGPNPKDGGPLGVYKCKEVIHDMFLQTGQKDLLMSHLRHKTTQHGWTWKMRDEFVEYIKKRGSDNVNVSHMITDLAPMSRELFPEDLKQELLDSMLELTKDYFTIDDTVEPITDPDNANSEAEKTFMYQTKDTKPEPGIGIGVEMGESPPPSPEESDDADADASASSTPHQSPGPVSSSNTPRQSPSQNTPRQSPSTAPKGSPLSTSSRPMTPQPLLPPPVLRPETASAVKSEPVVRNSSNEEEEPEEEDDDEDARNEEDDEDELMDV